MNSCRSRRANRASTEDVEPADCRRPELGRGKSCDVLRDGCDQGRGVCAKIVPVAYLNIGGLVWPRSDDRSGDRDLAAAECFEGEFGVVEGAEATSADDDRGGGIAEGRGDVGERVVFLVECD